MPIPAATEEIINLHVSITAAELMDEREKERGIWVMLGQCRIKRVEEKISSIQESKSEKGQRGIMSFGKDSPLIPHHNNNPLPLSNIVMFNTHTPKYQGNKRLRIHVWGVDCVIHAKWQ